MINGSVKTICVHGAVECVNDDCKAARCGHTIRGWGDNAALAIAITGYSNLVSRPGEIWRKDFAAFRAQIDFQDRDTNPSTSDSTGTNVGQCRHLAAMPQGPGQ